MQKQKIDSLFYLALQSTYSDIEVALFDKNLILGKKNINKLYASRDLLLNIDYLLNENNLTIENVSFSSLNQGPCSFNTLRVVIVTANALNFCGKIPIVGINGLYALLESYKDEKFQITIALLNAYNNDVYYAIEHNKHVVIGCKNISLFLDEIKMQNPEINIRFIGNGVDLFKDEIKLKFNDLASFIDPNPQVSTIEQIAKMGYHNWITKTDVYQEVYPLYLKDAVNKSI